MNALDFHIEQYRELRAEALKYVDETKTTERYCLIALAAYYGFLFSNWGRVQLFGAVPWWIPVGLAVCGGLRSLALFMSIRNNAEYLCRLEGSFFGSREKEEPKPVGWEQFRQKELPWYRKGALNSSLVFWPLVWIITIWVALTPRPPADSEPANNRPTQTKVVTNSP